MSPDPDRPRCAALTRHRRPYHWIARFGSLCGWHAKPGRIPRRLGGNGDGLLPAPRMDPVLRAWAKEFDAISDGVWHPAAEFVEWVELCAIPAPKRRRVFDATRRSQTTRTPRESSAPTGMPGFGSTRDVLARVG